MYQLSLDQGQIPDELRRANVPIYEIEKKHQPSNYRPVSLTSIATDIHGTQYSYGLLQSFTTFSVMNNMASEPA